jgi:hypothetical protein
MGALEQQDRCGIDRRGAAYPKDWLALKDASGCNGELDRRHPENEFSCIRNRPNN